jgi:hypothetical protein
MNPCRQTSGDTKCEIPMGKIQTLNIIYNDYKMHLRQFDWGDGLLKSNEGIQ